MTNHIQQPIPLDQIKAGQQAVIVALEQTGVQRRRLMDLGFVPGTQIEIALKNPLGDPTAYLVRGAVIALRRVQARQIQVALVESIPVQEKAS
jgi:DtxR family Mn-dependent transcriptional regulator/ferrous iron transport protein A